ncbi:hypothetical protein ACNKHX_24880 [Shigella flexneri]
MERLSSPYRDDRSRSQIKSGKVPLSDLAAAECALPEFLIALWRKMRHQLSQKFSTASAVRICFSCSPYGLMKASSSVGRCLFSHRAAPRHGSETPHCERRIVVRFSVQHNQDYLFKMQNQKQFPF